MIVLGIESTAHTFGASIIDSDKKKVLSNIRKAYTTDEAGMIPAKVADFHIENCDSVIEEALEVSKKRLEQEKAKGEKALEKAHQAHEEKKIKASKKKEWFEIFRWFYTSEGFFVIGGRDATTNDIIIKKHRAAHAGCSHCFSLNSQRINGFSHQAVDNAVITARTKV